MIRLLIDISDNAMTHAQLAAAIEAHIIVNVTGIKQDANIGVAGILVGAVEVHA